MKTLLLAILFSINSYACALCATYSPTAHVSTEFLTQNNNIKSVKFLWTFSENFTNLMLQVYDINSNKILEKDELEEILRGLLDYLVPNEFLTKIEHYKDGEDAVASVLRVKDYEMFIGEGRLRFMLEFFLDLKIEEGLVISTEVVDRGEYFYFTFLDERSKQIAPNFYIVQNANSNINFFKIVGADVAKKDDEKPRLSEILSQKPDYSYIDRVDSEKFDAISKAGIGFLDKIKEIFRQNRQDPSAFSLFMILFFSFGYGFLHAAGPGHAKLLTSSYFAANGGSYARAFSFALKVGFMHVFGAFLLVCATFLALSEVSAILSRDVAMFSTMFCGAAVIFISLYMIYKKIKGLKKVKIYKWNTHAPSCKCAVCSGLEKSKDSYKEWFIAITSALIPCPGVILVFILAFELGSYILGAMSGLFMGFGMSVVIFIAGVFGQKINQNSFLNFKGYRLYVELIALALMFGLGIFMIFASLKGGVF